LNGTQLECDGSELRPDGTCAKCERINERIASHYAGTFPPTEPTQAGVEVATYAHTCSDGHHEIGFNDPDDEYSERCPLCSETDRLVDGVRDHLISLGVPDSRIDGAGCDSGDPLDFTTIEITQAFSYVEDQNAERLATARASAITECVEAARAKAEEYRATAERYAEHAKREELPEAKVIDEDSRDQCFAKQGAMIVFADMLELLAKEERANTEPPTTQDRKTTIQSCIDIVNNASIIPFAGVAYVDRDQVVRKLEALVKGEGEDEARSNVS